MNKNSQEFMDDKDIWSYLMDYNDASTRGELFTAKLLEVGKVRYPKFGNILIMAGGPGSGKGYQRKYLIGLEGKVLDIDKVKDLVLDSEYFRKLIKEKFNWDIKDGNLKDPEFGKRLHRTIIKLGYPQKLYDGLMYVEELKERKPNLIFDVTLGNFDQFESICEIAKILQYDSKKVHLIWVINTLDIALKQNANRARVVKEDTVKNIYKGVSITLLDICKLGERITDYLDGDIWFSFNRENIDVIKKESEIGDGFFIEEANMIKIKSAGGPIQFPQNEAKEITQKVYEYTKDENWRVF